MIWLYHQLPSVTNSLSLICRFFTESVSTYQNNTFDISGKSGCPGNPLFSVLDKSSGQGMSIYKVLNTYRDKWTLDFFLSTVESRFLKPPGETQIGWRNRGVPEIGGKITWFDWGEGTTFGSSYREVRKNAVRVRGIGIPATVTQKSAFYSRWQEYC